MTEEEFLRYSNTLVSQYDHRHDIYDRWVDSIQRFMPLTPDCFRGPREGLPDRLALAFATQCSANPNLEILFPEIKRRIIWAFGHHIATLPLWDEVELRTQTMLGIVPLMPATISEIATSRHRNIGVYEAVEIAWVVTAFFASAGYIGNPAQRAEYPVRWGPYVSSPSTRTIKRSESADIASAARHFRHYRDLLPRASGSKPGAKVSPFNWNKQFAAPDNATTPEFSVRYFASCSGVDKQNTAPSHLAGFMAKFLLGHEFYNEQHPSPPANVGSLILIVCNVTSHPFHQASIVPPRRTIIDPKFWAPQASSAMSLISPLSIYLDTLTTYATMPRLNNLVMVSAFLG